MNIQNGIKYAREKLNMTQEELAVRTAVDVNVIKDWEENNTTISLRDVRRLVKHLKARTNLLLLGVTKDVIDLSNLTESQIDEIFSLYITTLKEPEENKRKINEKISRSIVQDFGYKAYYIRVKLL